VNSNTNSRTTKDTTDNTKIRIRPNDEVQGDSRRKQKTMKKNAAMG